MKTILLLISLFCNEDASCVKEISICMDRRIWSYSEINNYNDNMYSYALYECLGDKGFLR